MGSSVALAARFIRRHRFLLLAAVVALFVIAAAATAYLLAPKTVIITRTATGFSPRIITIHKGDTVDFVSTIDRPMWPASDSHPSHDLYPEFDPKQAVAAGSDWRFTFNRVGVWKFHDHMSSNYTGIIVVEGLPGESTAECLKGGKNGSLIPSCWAAEVTKLINTKGLAAAFDRIDELYVSNPTFRRNCHDVMHVVGSAAYQRFSTDDSVMNTPETRYCGYGFYHGFMEAMVSANGPAHYEDARRYCDELDQKFGGAASGPCYHGIGHALFDSEDGALWGQPRAMYLAGLEMCESALSSPFSLDQCGSGIANSFANAMSAKSYELSYAGYDAAAFCGALEPLYRKGCMKETGLGSLRNRKFDRAQVFSFIEALPPTVSPYKTDLYYAYFADELKQHFATFEGKAYADDCVTQPAGLHSVCIRGVLQGIREEAQTASASKYLFSVCAGLEPGSLRDECVVDVVRHTLRPPGGDPVFTALCRETAGNLADKLCVK